MIESRALGDLLGPLHRHKEELHPARVSMPVLELLARTLRNVDDVVVHRNGQLRESFFGVFQAFDVYDGLARHVGGVSVGKEGQGLTGRGVENVARG